MLHAYDEDMINGDFVFIIFELDQTQVALYSKQPFKWFFSSYKPTLNRYHHVKKAFEAAFVLAIKSPASKTYAKFTAEVKRRSPEEPFNSTVYQGYLWKANSKFLANKTKVKCWYLTARIVSLSRQVSKLRRVFPTKIDGRICSLPAVPLGDRQANHMSERSERTEISPAGLERAHKQRGTGGEAVLAILWSCLTRLTWDLSQTGSPTSFARFMCDDFLVGGNLKPDSRTKFAHTGLRNARIQV